MCKKDIPLLLVATLAEIAEYLLHSEKEFKKRVNVLNLGKYIDPEYSEDEEKEIQKIKKSIKSREKGKSFSLLWHLRNKSKERRLRTEVDKGIWYASDDRTLYAPDMVNILSKHIHKDFTWLLPKDTDNLTLIREHGDPKEGLYYPHPSVPKTYVSVEAEAPHALLAETRLKKFLTLAAELGATRVSGRSEENLKDHSRDKFSISELAKTIGIGIKSETRESRILTIERTFAPSPNRPKITCIEDLPEDLLLWAKNDDEFNALVQDRIRYNITQTQAELNIAKEEGFELELVTPFNEFMGLEIGYQRKECRESIWKFDICFEQVPAMA